MTREEKTHGRFPGIIFLTWRSPFSFKTCKKKRNAKRSARNHRRTQKTHAAQEQHTQKVHLTILKNKIELMNVHKTIKTTRNKIKRNAPRWSGFLDAVRWSTKEIRWRCAKRIKKAHSRKQTAVRWSTRKITWKRVFFIQNFYPPILLDFLIWQPPRRRLPQNGAVRSSMSRQIQEYNWSRWDK